MKRVIQWIIGILVFLVAVGSVAVLTGKLMAERKRVRHIDVAVVGVPYATGAAVLERGRYLYASRGCADCHGIDGRGREFANDGKGTRLVGSNITPAGVVAQYQPQDWVRAIRHGVKPNGQPLLVMPSEDYNRLTNDDLAAIVAHVRALPAAESEVNAGRPVIDLPLPAWVAYGFDWMPDAAQRIDHTLPPQGPVAAGLSVEHGAYVAHMCTGCHGKHFSGGRIPVGPPDWPPAANLTPGEGSVMARYPDEQTFLAMLRSGLRPDGTAIAVMPFLALRQLDDTDARAMYRFLKTLPARPAGQY